MRHKLKKILLAAAILAGTLLLPLAARAVVCNVIAGCTGRGTATAESLLISTTSLQSLTYLPIGSNGNVLWVTATGKVGWTATSTLGISGGSGNSAWTIGNALIYNATSTDLVGIGTITPTTTLFVQGKGGTNPLVVASSTGTAMFTVGQNGALTVPSASQSTFTSTVSAGSIAISNFTTLSNNGNDLLINNSGTDRNVYIRTGSVNRISVLSTASGGYVGVGTGTPTGVLAVAGTSTAPTISPLIVSSSTGITTFEILANGSTTIANLNASACDVKSTTAGALFCGIDATGASSGNAAWTIGSSLIYNATSTDLIGIGTVTPTTTLFVQGKGGINPFQIASSTGTAMLTVAQNGSTTIPSLVAGVVYSTSGGSLYVDTLPGGTNCLDETGGIIGVTGSGDCATLGGNNAFVGTNSFAATTTMATTTIVRLGVGTTTPNVPLLVVGSTTLSSLSNALPVRSTVTGALFNGQILNADIANSTIDLTAKVTGVLPVANGGTGTSTAPSQQGQILGADSTGAKYAPITLINGSNITITTSTVGQITIAASGGGTPCTSTGYSVQYNNAGSFGCISKLLTDGTLVGYNATSSTISFNIQGISASTNDIFNVASSSGTSIFKAYSNGDVGVANIRYTWPGAQGTQGLFLGNTGTGILSWLKPSFYATVCSSGCNYNATGTADQVGLNAAITAANAAGGGTILIKAGSYSLSTSTLLANVNNITLMGEGDGTKLTVDSNGDGSIRILNSSNITIQNLKIDGSSQNTGAFNGDIAIAAINSHNIRIDHNSFSNVYGFGIFIDSQINNSTTNVTILNNIMQCNGRQDCIGGGPDTDGFSTTSDISVLNNIISQQAYTGSVENSTSDLNCMDLVRVLKLTFSQNQCHGNVVFGSEKSPHAYSIVDGNVIDKPEGPVLASGEVVLLNTNDTAAASNTPSNISVTNNLLRSGKIMAVGTSNNPVQGLLISGNNITTSTSTAQSYNSIAQHGIYIDTAFYPTVTGNNVEGYQVSTSTNTSAGVYLTNATYSNVSNNTVKDFSICVRQSSGAGNKSELNNCINTATVLSNSTVVLHMDNTGNIGIGTSTPNVPLLVVGSTTITSLATVGCVNSTATGALYVASCGGGSLSGGTLDYLARWTSATTLSKGITIDNNVVAGVNATSSTVSFNVQGTTTLDPFNVTSSTGTSLFVVKRNGNVGIATATPAGALGIVGSIYQNGSYTKLGAAVPNATCAGNACVDLAGSDNTTSGVGLAAENINAGTSAFSYLALNNNRVNASAVTGIAGLQYNSSAYTDTTFGTAFGTADLLSLFTQDGPISIIAGSSTGASYITLNTGGGATTNERMRITAAGKVGIASVTPGSTLSLQGTSAQAFPLFQVASSSNASVFSISQNGYFTLQPNATSTTAFVMNAPNGSAILTIDNTPPTGNMLTIASSTGNNVFTVDINGAVVASSTITSKAWLGNGGVPTVATSTGAGTASTAVLVNATDSNGLISVNALTSPAANGTIVTLTFSKAFTNPPNCQVTPASTTAASILIAAATTTTTTLKLFSSTALTTAKNYSYYYWCPSN